MSLPRSLYRPLVMLCIAPTIVACGQSNAVDNSKCSSYISNYSSPAPGTLTLTGGFFIGESILIRDSSGALLGTGTPDTNRGSLTFTGLPSGTRQLTIIASCNAGQRQIDQGDYTIK